MAFFGVIPKRLEPASIPGALSVEGPTPDAFSLAEGKCDVWAWERLVVVVKFAVVGGGAASGGPAGCSGEKVTCVWAVL